MRFFLLMLLTLLAVITWYPRDGETACGAAASSCRNCHEIQGKMRVNDKGDYHTQHAFGDFCVFCHSGSPSAMIKDEAHKGMVKPFENLEQSCASCHPDDFEKRAGVYGAFIKPGVSASRDEPAAIVPESEGEAEKRVSPTMTMDAVPEAPVSRKDLYEILPPTPDPSAVKPENMIDYNLFWVKKGLPFTTGDLILILLSIILAMGFPFLYWFYRVRRSGKSN